jgi:hypothetical protein
VHCVSCWVGKVHDRRAAAFSHTFYGSLEHDPGDYGEAVRKGKTNLRNAKRREFAAGNPVPRERLCLLSADGDDRPGDSEDDCGWGAASDGEAEAEAEAEGLFGQSAAAEGSDDEAGAAGEVGDAAADPSAELQPAARDPVRAATNKQGRAERAAFEALKFKLAVGPDRLSIEAGVKLYESDAVTPPDAVLSNGRRLREYGLKESKRALHPGSTSTKKHLYYERWALRKVFGRPDLDSYEELFAEGGALETRVEQLEAKSHSGDAPSLQQLQRARASLQTALEERRRQLAAAAGRGEDDESHRRMVDALARLLRRIKEAVAGPRAAPAAAGIEGSVEGMSIEGGADGGGWQAVEKRRR